MDTISIKTFVAVTETESFSRAADLLFLTQPAVSKRIAALEEELGSRLFDRIGKKVILTETGNELYPRAKRILFEIEDSRKALANLSGEVSGKLTFGTSHHIGLHRLPPVLRRFSTAFPKVELDIHFLDSEKACSAVRQGDLEMAIVTLPNMTQENLVMRTVWEDPLCAVAARNHPVPLSFQPKQPVVEANDLAGHPAILPGSGTFTRELIDRELNKCGIEVRVKLSTNYLETIKMLVSIGLGWSFLPESMIDKDLVKIRVRGMDIKRNLGVVNHKARTLTNAAVGMMSLLSTDGY